MAFVPCAFYQEVEEKIMAFTFNLSVAGMTFQVTTLHRYSQKYCERYLIDEPGEHIIQISQEEIDAERRLCSETETGVSESLCTSPDHYLESVCLLRTLANYITLHNRILMHGSAIAVNGKGYIFTALSGTGKSTHTALLRKLHGENAVMINDDKPFLHIAEDQIFVCGTPWMGKHFLGNNVTVPLAGIFFLRRSEENVLQKLEPDAALTLLLTQCHRPEDPEKMMHTLEMLDSILSRVPLYDFGCNMDISAAELSSSVM